MEDYDHIETKIDLNDLKAILSTIQKPTNKKEATKKINSEKEIKEYLENTKRTKEWYRTTDEKLYNILINMTKLSNVQHTVIRTELAAISSLLIEKCHRTMPKSITVLIEILITLTQDEDETVRAKAHDCLKNLSEKFNDDSYRTILENVQERFLNCVKSLPRVFNGIDENEKIRSLNLIIGFIKLFGSHKFCQILHSTHLEYVMSSLLQICELEKTDVSRLEEYAILDFELNTEGLEPWKKFSHFKDQIIRDKIKIVCQLLSNKDVINIAADYLIGIFYEDIEQRKEAVFVLNEILSGYERHAEKFNVIKTVLLTYIDENYWNLPISLADDVNGNCCTLSEVQNNILQICLQTEGIGVFALELRGKFQRFLLKTLYLVLERAGKYVVTILSICF